MISKEESLESMKERAIRIIEETQQEDIADRRRRQAEKRAKKKSRRLRCAKDKFKPKAKYFEY